MSEIVSWRALDSRVLVVAVKRVDGWCAYIGAVPGQTHELEIQDVRDHGAKLSKRVALAIFPSFKGTPYAW